MGEVKSWTQGVPFADNAREQIGKLASLPIVWPHVAVMPDVHLGIGCSVGTVVPTRRAIIPAAVGVDIGCGMTAARTPLTSADLGDSAREVFEDLSLAVPHGSARSSSVGTWGGCAPQESVRAWSSLERDYEYIVRGYPKCGHDKALDQLGTLGGGNHFVEVCLDESDRVWVMLHSGSRGVGNRIGTLFTELAREEMLRLDRSLPDRDLAYLEEGAFHFKDYCHAVEWAQRYASENRAVMMRHCLRALSRRFSEKELDFERRTLEAVSCHHNYVSREEHFGESLWVTRKGAVSAREGELGIIPGSMGAKSFIVRGRGNAESFHSCSHGAGRVMSRGEAKRSITVAQHVKDTAGVACSKDARVLDESPRAYKDIDAVMAAQSDLVEVVHTLKQVACLKG